MWVLALALHAHTIWGTFVWDDRAAVVSVGIPWHSMSGIANDGSQPTVQIQTSPPQPNAPLGYLTQCWNPNPNPTSTPTPYGAPSSGTTGPPW